jgi:hypothetical protein
MTDCVTPSSLMRFDTSAGLALEAAFDGGRITSDGGLTWLAQTDEDLRLCESLAQYVPEWRTGERCATRWSRSSSSVSFR